MNDCKYYNGMTFENEMFRLYIWNVSDDSIDCQLVHKKESEYWEYKDISYSSFETIRKQFGL